MSAPLPSWLSPTAASSRSRPAHGGQGLRPRPLHEPVPKRRSARRRSSQSNTKLTRGVPGALATGWLGAAALVASGEGFGLQPLKLRLVDRAGVQQLLGLGDLLGGGRLAGGRDVAHVAGKLLL